MSTSAVSEARCYNQDSDALSNLVNMAPIIDEILSAMIAGRLVGPMATRESVERYMIHIVKAYGATQRYLQSNPDHNYLESSPGGGDKTLLEAA